MTHPFVDSHLHLDHVLASHPDRIGWLRDRGATAVSWAFSHRVERTADLTAYWDRQRQRLREAEGQGLRCYYLVGVHPRNIPPELAPEELRDLLVPRLEDPRCLGIGEIGLETGSPRETEILEAQLDLAQALRADQVFGVHTPRGEKAERTADVLRVLERHPAVRERTVVDHCTPQTVGWVLAAGYRAGVTVSPAKCSAEDVRSVAAAHPDALDRILLNTDSGTEFHEDLHRLVAGGLLPEAQADALARQNALSFYGLGGR